MAKINLNGLSVKNMIELRSNLDKAIAERKQVERADSSTDGYMAAAAGLSLAEVMGTGQVVPSSPSTRNPTMAPRRGPGVAVSRSGSWRR